MDEWFILIMLKWESVYRKRETVSFSLTFPQLSQWKLNTPTILIGQTLLAVYD